MVTDPSRLSDGPLVEPLLGTSPAVLVWAAVVLFLAVWWARRR